MDERVLFKLYIASIKGTDDLHPNTKWGYDALRWYIVTGRACLEFVRAIDALSERRLVTLVRRAAQGSTNEGINNAYKYLKMARH